MLTVLRSLLPRSCASITPRTSAWSAVLDGSTTSTAHTEPGRVSLLLLLKFHGLFIILSVLRSNAEIIKVELGWWFDVVVVVVCAGGREKAPAAFCRKALTATERFEMWGDGLQTRSFTFIDECVEGVLR